MNIRGKTPLDCGINRVNEQTIEKYFGKKLEKADADFTREVTGFAIGDVPPVGHRQKIETFIDNDLPKGVNGYNSKSMTEKWVTVRSGMNFYTL